MFKLFKKKSEVEVLQEKYEKLMTKYHKLSTVNRTESDKVYAEAQEVLDKLNLITK
jgi:hypothetical protein